MGSSSDIPAAPAGRAAVSKLACISRYHAALAAAVTMAAFAALGAICGRSKLPSLSAYGRISRGGAIASPGRGKYQSSIVFPILSVGSYRPGHSGSSHGRVSP